MSFINDMNTHILYKSTITPQVTQRRKQERFTCCTKNPSFYFNVPPDDNNGPGGNLAPFETLSVMS